MFFRMTVLGQLANLQRLLPAVLVLIWGTPVYSSDASTDRVNIGVIVQTDLTALPLTPR